MKKLSFLILLLLAIPGFISVTFADSSRTIRIAADAAYPPFNYKDANGEIVGFDVDLTMAICNAAGIKCKFLAQDWDGLIPGLLVKKYDAISASMNATEERRKRVAFTNKIYSNPSRFLVKKSANFTFDKNGLSGKTLAAQHASVQADFLEKEFGNVAKVALYETQEQANLDLASGRVDALLGEVVALSESFLKSEAGKSFEFKGKKYAFGDGVAIAMRKNDSELLKKFNDGIDKIRKSGEYQKISDQHFGFDIY